MTWRVLDPSARSSPLVGRRSSRPTTHPRLLRSSALVPTTETPKTTISIPLPFTMTTKALLTVTQARGYGRGEMPRKSHSGHRSHLRHNLYSFNRDLLFPLSPCHTSIAIVGITFCQPVFPTQIDLWAFLLFYLRADSALFARTFIIPPLEDPSPSHRTTLQSVCVRVLSL
jgi:hypothetical protein